MAACDMKVTMAEILAKDEVSHLVIYYMKRSWRKWASECGVPDSSISWGHGQELTWWTWLRDFPDTIDALIRSSRESYIDFDCEFGESGWLEFLAFIEAYTGIGTLDEKHRSPLTRMLQSFETDYPHTPSLPHDKRWTDEAMTTFMLRFKDSEPEANNNRAFRQAARTGKVGVLKALLADPRVRPTSHGHDSALARAAENAHTDVVECLLAHGQSNPETALLALRLHLQEHHEMRSGGRHAAIRHLLESDPRVDNDCVTATIQGMFRSYRAVVM